MCMRVAIAAVFALLIGAVAGARAIAQDGNHGQGHAENHDWYEKLKQPGSNASCCNGPKDGVEGDCRPTRAYQKDDGVWYALLNGRWVPVPPRVVLKQLAPDGNSHICANKGGVIFCFLGGSPKS
ncbi:hypothetical protein [Reyranella sp.]|uniref:hypothetical protein n=1 Tax=Reyranella sp. TaxID=1929291 RepID=UPI00272F5552|nr:hypothetical protein [Reyranella sp.]